MITNTDPSPEIYWAADETKMCADEVYNRIDNYYEALNNNGLMGLWLQSYRYYFGGRMRGGRVNNGGDQGEYQVLNVNHYRNLLLHIKQIACSTRPAFEPRAVNSDIKSQKQTILARGLLDYYMREKRVDRDLDTATEFCLAFGEGFVHTRWNATSGKVWATDPDSGAEYHDGDVVSKAFEPIDVIRDPMLEQYRERSWVVVRDRINKYELAAKYPEFASELIALQPSIETTKHYRKFNQGPSYQTDEVVLYYFYHVKNDACPDGREMLLCDNNIILSDGPLSYRHLPVHRMAANEEFGSPWGYSVSSDLSALQENYDMLFSTITTNQQAFGVSNIVVEKGSGYNVIDMAGQMKFIEIEPGGMEPKVLNLLNTSPEVFNFLSTVEATMQTISGVNSVSRGDPQASLKSGAALALVQSMAIQFNEALQGAYVELLEDVGTGLIELLQDYAKTPRIAAIVGEYDRSYIKEFTGKDLDQIDRIIVDAGNPMLQTVAGKMELAQTMLQAGFIKMPDELMSVINTGSLQPLIQGKSMEVLQVQQEGEMLKNGEKVMAIITDDHVLHIQEHKSVLADPQARMDESILTVTLAHLQEHIDMLKDPQYQQLLQLMGQPALGGQPPMGGPQPPVGPGGAGQPGALMPPPGANAQVAAMQPNQPNQPKNALTGQRFNTANGGLPQ